MKNIYNPSIHIGKIYLLTIKSSQFSPTSPHLFPTIQTMDKPQEEMQEVGFFGIYKESVKTILLWKKIFTQITLTFILPMSFIFLAHIVVAEIIDWKIEGDEDRLYRRDGDSHLYHKLSSEWIGYWIFRLIYMSFLLLFSLLSTAAVVYTIAAAYSGDEVTFKKVLKIVPKVWKRLSLTFLWTYLGFFIYNVVTGVVFFIWATTTTDSTFAVVVFYILLSMYLIGFIYITVIWQLASVVTVLESSYGLKAMMKGNALIKGKRWLSWFTFFGLYCIFVGILILFYLFVWYGFVGILVGLVCVFLLMNLFLLGYVVQTMLYLVCKSYHREPIDKMGLSTQLGGYLGEFEPAFKANKDIQLGQPQVQVWYLSMIVTINKILQIMCFSTKGGVEIKNWTFLFCWSVRYVQMYWSSSNKWRTKNCWYVNGLNLTQWLLHLFESTFKNHYFTQILQHNIIDVAIFIITRSYTKVHMVTWHQTDTKPKHILTHILPPKRTLTPNTPRNE